MCGPLEIALTIGVYAFILAVLAPIIGVVIITAVHVALEGTPIKRKDR